MSAPRRTSNRRQRTGIAEIDDLLARIVEIVGGPDADVVAEAAATVVRLGIDGADRGDLKIVAGALRELRRAFLLYERYEDVPKVSVFGSARTPEEDPNYVAAMEFSRLMVERGWMPITGGGPGIMQAANEGAGPGRSFGLNIRLPFEQTANPFIEGDDKLVTFRYFFTRKLEFAKEARAYAFFPGGFGTLDEAFEVLTLTQTGKGALQPIVFVGAEGERYWSDFLGFVRRHLLDGAYVDADDLDLVRLARGPEEAVEEIVGFYRNFRSQRYVEGRLYLRLETAPDADELAALNDEFAGIVLDGEIEVVPPHPDEIADGDDTSAARIAFDFDRRSFGQLRHLVDTLNTLPSLRA
ncbi:MAG: TIGR00730 family Rossman fold protein [Acidimicrobiia bacterium]|nr:TIGR00730 family Rossman fold protein [Acidimicrobiia bacterium]